MKAIIDSFDEVACAPGGIERLRKLVLELAVRGKLVEQDPKDEPASVLIEKIREEKISRRAAETRRGRGNRSAELPPITEEEKPFDLPRGWEWVRMGEIGSIIGGGTPKTDNPEYWTNATIPWITPADLNSYKDVYISKGRKNITAKALEESSAQILPAGTVLFSSRAPIGYVAIAANKIATNQGFKSCIPHDVRLNLYLYYFLKSAADIIDTHASGTTFKEVSGKEVAKILVPLPPLAEQSRIVARVQELMGALDGLEEREKLAEEVRRKALTAALAELAGAQAGKAGSKAWKRLADGFDCLVDSVDDVKELRKTILELAVRGRLVEQDPKDEPASVLLEKIRQEKASRGGAETRRGRGKRSNELPPVSDEEKPFELPRGWEWVRLGELGNIISGGTPASGNIDYWENADVPWVCPKDMKQPTITKTLDYISMKAVAESNLEIVNPGTLLLVVRGMILVRKVPSAIAMVPLTINQDMKALIPHVLGIATFLSLCIDGNNNFLLDLVEHSSHGTCKLETPKLMNFIIALPPLAEQARIVARVEELFRVCDELERGLGERDKAAKGFADAAVARALAG